jgi:hypothetical protein
MITTFYQATDGSPEKNIFSMVKKALQYVAVEQYLTTCLGYILTNVTSLSTAQKVAVKFACFAFPKERWDDNINNLLMYILYGTFQEVNLDEAVENALTDDQREQILEQAFLAAKSIIIAQAQELQTLIDIGFVAPDWRIVVSETPETPNPPTEP